MNSIEFSRFNCLSHIHVHAFTPDTHTFAHARIQNQSAEHTQKQTQTKWNQFSCIEATKRRKTQRNDENTNTEATVKESKRPHTYAFDQAAAASRRSSRSTAVKENLTLLRYRLCFVWMCVCVCVCPNVHICVRAECVLRCVWVLVHVCEEFEWMVATATAIQQQKAANKQNEWTCVCKPYYALCSVALLSLSLSLWVFSYSRLLPPHLFFERFVARWSSSFNSFVKAITLDFIFVVVAVFPLKREANKI